jgi:hypothetical protein
MLLPIQENYAVYLARFLPSWEIWGGDLKIEDFLNDLGRKFAKEKKKDAKG